MHLTNNNKDLLYAITRNRSLLNDWNSNYVKNEMNEEKFALNFLHN
jgi:hypothetical protein